MICGLDIGSSKIKVILAKERPLELVAKKEIESEGVRRGIVIESERVANLLTTLFRQIQQETKHKVFEVFTSFNGSHLFSLPSKGLISVSRADRRISQEDVQRVIQAAQEVNLSPNKKAFDFTIQNFIVDGETRVDDPVDLEGLKLEVEILSFCGFVPYLENHKKAILKSGLEILDAIPAPLASAKAVLTERQKEIGVGVIDIGAGTTSLAIFEEQNLIHFSVLPIGSSNITNDIAIALKIDFELAERIKKEFGACFFRGKDSFFKVETEGDHHFLVSKKTLSRVIGERVNEIFSQINQELKKINKVKKLPAGIVLTGGGAKLEGIKELAKEEFQLPVKIGKILKCPDLENELEYSVAWGLVLHGLEEGEATKKWEKRGVLEKIKNFFRIFIP